MSAPLRQPIRREAAPGLTITNIPSFHLLAACSPDLRERTCLGYSRRLAYYLFKRKPRISHHYLSLSVNIFSCIIVIDRHYNSPIAIC